MTNLPPLTNKGRERTGFTDNRPLQFGEVLYYKGKEYIPNGFTVYLEFKKGGGLDRRFKCNRDYEIRNPVQDFYDRSFFKRIL